MSCEPTRERLYELDVVDFASLEHLGECPDCAELADRITAAERLLAAHVEEHVKASDFDDVWPGTTVVEPVGRSRIGWVALALAAAATLVFAWWSGGPSEERPAPPPAPATAPVPPEAPPVVGENVDRFFIFVGEIVALGVPARVEETTIDSERVRVLFLRDDMVGLVGLSPGPADIALQTSKGPRSYPVEVAPAPAVDAFTSSGDDVVLAPGESATLSFEAPVELARGGEPEVIGLSVGQDGRTVQLEGLREGVSSVVVLLDGQGRPRVRRVLVRAQ